MGDVVRVEVRDGGEQLARDEEGLALRVGAAARLEARVDVGAGEVGEDVVEVGVVGEGVEQRREVRVRERPQDGRQREGGRRVRVRDGLDGDARGGRRGGRRAARVHGR